MNTIDIIRFTNIILTVASIGVWIYFYRRFREPAAIAPLTWFFNLLAFYVVRFYTQGSYTASGKEIQLLNCWSNLLQTHILILFGVGAILGMKRLIRNETYMKRLKEKLEKEELEKKEGEK